MLYKIELNRSTQTTNYIQKQSLTSNFIIKTKVNLYKFFYKIFISYAIL